MNRIPVFLSLLSGLILTAAAAPVAAQSQDPAAVAAWEVSMREALQDKPAEPASAKQSATQATVQDRGNLNNQQDSAPRPDNQVLDPKFKGFIPVPGTPVMLKFNAKPRVDMTLDNRNAGDDNRFITAKIPVSTDADHGGGHVFNINAKGSQLSLDVQAPEVEGSPRFYYQNDFYGSGSGEFPFRVRQLYGKIYNVVVGMTFSVFEDPDVWPDTIDYEGPNSAIFARRPLARLMIPLNPEWQVNVGIEQPESEIDTTVDTNAAGVNHGPDIGANVRWESADFGHVQFAMMARELGVRGPIVGNQRTFGYGLNLSTVVNVSTMDSLQFQLTYGEGIFRYSNDDFVNNDAAFDSSGDLKALPYLGIMFGFTHRWNAEWRSTASYGYVNLDNELSQGPTAYHRTQYASANLVWQLRKRLSVGVEGLYGSKEDQAGHTGDVFRLQFGLLYSLMD